MQQLISDFSNKELSSFFKNKISSFVPKRDNLQYVIDETQFSSFADLTKVGEVSFQDSNELLVFSCKYNGILSERTSRKRQFDVAKKVLKEDFKDGAIFVFYDDAKKFRFSFVRKNYGKKGDERYSTWKRFTYFVDPKETNKTFKERIGNCQFSNLESIQDAFSVEKLTKDFYNDLFKWYQWTLSEEVGITYPNNTTIAEDDRIKLEEQVIRLITRLLFVWFIKQKHLVPDNLFNTEELAKVLKNFDPESTTDGNYYNAILQNLFFATLNKAIDERDFAKTQNRDVKSLYRYDEMFKISQEEMVELFNSIPFLNGGLFECLDKEDLDGNKYYLDGFSRNANKLKGHFKHRAFIPNCVFFDEKKGIIPLLERYNFTVEENAPNEIQVALDPELLGNVFENLLGAFNAETKETARKQSGSFYTPKEVVSYMVDESLISYLSNKFPKLEKNIIRQLFEEDTLPEPLAIDHTLCERLSDALKQVKILDPACGSGAFPMGILNKMVVVLQKLDCNKNETVYEQKLHLIEECIYGVDLQTIAVQISKLRFFISLIVEQGMMDMHKENYGVIPLPNLETKFVAANTLIDAKKKKQGEFVADLFEDPRIGEVKKAILKVRHEHFYAKTVYTKKQLREKDKSLCIELAELLALNHDAAPEDAKQLARWNPYDQNVSSPFFDPEWMFGLADGFDVIIGNPPYIQLQNDSGRLAKLFQDCGYRTFARMGDIYSLFYERGWQLLKQNGALCYITSNKWMRAGYGENTRQFFADSTNPLLLIDFAGQKIFESATVDTNILLFRKTKNEKKTTACVIRDKVLNKLSDYVRQCGTIGNFSTSESWVVLTDVEQQIKIKIEKIGIPLKDWDISIYRGILTGYNEAFIIDKKKRAELIAEDPKSAEIIRPILRGRDIRRYSNDFAEQYLIAIFPSKNYNIEEYSAVKRFLEGFKPKLKQTGETLTQTERSRITAHAKNNGITLNESSLKTSRKKTNNKWFETQDSISYWEDFFRQKIIWGEISDKTKFSIDLDGEFIPEATTFLMTGNSLLYLLGFLNSSLSEYLFAQIGTTTGVGTVRWKKFTIEQLRVPKISKEKEKVYSEIVLKIIEDLKNGKNITPLVEAIDNMIYKEFDLTDEEIKVITG